MIKEIEALQEAIKGEKRIAKNFYKIAASFPEDCNEIENDDVVAVDERGEFDFGCPKCNWTSRVFSKAMIPLCPKCHIEMWPIPGKYY